jgi:hypothetical protein
MPSSKHSTTTPIRNTLSEITSPLKGWSVVTCDTTYDGSGYINPIPQPGDADYTNIDDAEEYGHGTLVAGVLWAVGNNTRGVTGVYIYTMCLLEVPGH